VRFPPRSHGFSRADPSSGTRRPRLGEAAEFCANSLHSEPGPLCSSVSCLGDRTLAGRGGSSGRGRRRLVGGTRAAGGRRGSSALAGWRRSSTRRWGGACGASGGWAPAQPGIDAAPKRAVAWDHTPVRSRMHRTRSEAALSQRAVLGRAHDLDPQDAAASPGRRAIDRRLVALFQLDDPRRRLLKRPRWDLRRLEGVEPGTAPALDVVSFTDAGWQPAGEVNG